MRDEEIYSQGATRRAVRQNTMEAAAKRLPEVEAERDAAIARAEAAEQARQEMRGEADGAQRLRVMAIQEAIDYEDERDDYKRKLDALVAAMVEQDAALTSPVFDARRCAEARAAEDAALRAAQALLTPTPSEVSA